MAGNESVVGVSLDEFERVVASKVAESDPIEGDRAVWVEIGGYLFRPAEVRLDHYGAVVISLNQQPAATVGMTTITPQE